MSNILSIQQGDSVRVSITLPIEKMGAFEGIVCSINSHIVDVNQVDNTNVFLVDLPSNFTKRLLGSQILNIALDYSDIGVRKLTKSECLELFVSENKNPLNNNSISEVINASVSVSIQNLTYENKTLNIQQGDSVRLKIVLPIDRMVNFQKLICSIQGCELTSTQNSNEFLIDLDSNFTKRLIKENTILVAVDYSDIGVRKLAPNDCIKLIVNQNSNPFSNNSISNTVNAVLEVEINETLLEADATLYQELINTNIAIVNLIKGEQGEQGIQGIQGEKGEQGEQGEQGIQGESYEITFETISKNLLSLPVEYFYTDGELTQKYYNGGVYIETYNYIAGELVSKTITGGGLNITKTYIFDNNGELTNINYT